MAGRWVRVRSWWPPTLAADADTCPRRGWNLRLRAARRRSCDQLQRAVDARDRRYVGVRAGTITGIGALRAQFLLQLRAVDVAHAHATFERHRGGDAGS